MSKVGKGSSKVFSHLRLGFSSAAATGLVGQADLQDL